jgi:putative peptide zinc metalloprotease protein
VTRPSAGAPPPRLRPELRFRRAGGPGDGAVIEDPLGGGFFETDAATAAFLRLLDGTRAPEAALADLRAAGLGAGLDGAEARAILEEAGRCGLFLGREGGAPRRPARRGLGLVSQRISVGPRRATFDAAAGLFGWTFGPFGAALWLVVVVWGVATLAARWGAAAAELGGLFSARSAPLVLAAWVISKLWHELHHGVAARRHGVEIRDAGVLLILFMPLGAYVDVSGAWRIPERWKRLQITAAGVIGEFGLGAAALILWAEAGPGPWRGFLLALATTAVVGAALFNLNPLMRFDAYHAIVDLARAPNLYQRAAEATERAGLRALAGRAAPAPDEPGWVRLYGWLSLGWRLALAAALSALAAGLAFGFGAALAAVAAWTMLAAPAGRFAAKLWALGPGARRTAALRLGLAALACAALWRAPLPVATGGPALIAHRDAAEARAGTEGRVAEVLTRAGARVAAGEPLLRLEDPGLDAALRRAQALAGRAAIEMRAAEAAGDLQAAAAAAGRRAVAEAEIVEIDVRRAALILRAPQSGTVLTADPAALAGRRLARGEAALEIGDPNALEVRAWLTPEAAEALAADASGYVFRSAASGAAEAALRLTRLAPDAGRDPPPAALTAEGGGPLDLDLSGEAPRLTTARVEARFAADGLAAAGFAAWPGLAGTVGGARAWRPAGDVLAERIGAALRGLDLRDPTTWPRALSGIGPGGDGA